MRIILFNASFTLIYRNIFINHDINKTLMLSVEQYEEKRYRDFIIRIIAHKIKRFTILSLRIYM